MKLNKFALTLTVAALLPTLAYAGTDSVAASFERDLAREPVKSAVIAGTPDAFTVEFYAALGGKIDPVLASFERDTAREPVGSTKISGEPDALTTEFYAALNGKTDAVLASFNRDMYRAPSAIGMVATGEPDALTTEFYAALRDVLNKPVMHAIIAGNGRTGS